MADSSTGGFLLPEGSPYSIPLEDAALDAFLQSLIAGITGFSTDYVRPRWQQTPPVQPPITQDWIAVGVQSQKVEAGLPVVIHRQTTTQGVSADVVQRHETVEILCSVYGPNCGNNASLIRDSFYIAQNRETLLLAGMGLKDVSKDILNVPYLRNDQWYPRKDVTVYLVRAVTRVYPILDLLSSSGTITTTKTSVTATWATANEKHGE